jgi:hypothetical protein
MILKEISHTSAQNPTYEFQKRKVHFQPFFLNIQFGNSMLLKIELQISKMTHNYQGLSFLPVTFIGFVGTQNRDLEITRQGLQVD